MDLPKKRKLYAPEDMANAVKNVEDSRMSSWDASRHFNVPYTTLKDQLKKSHPGKIGAKTLLTEDEELGLVEWIEEWALLGQPLTKEQVFDGAKKIADSRAGRSFGSKGPSFNWMKKFLQRHPLLTFRKPEAVTKAASTVTKLNIDIWFQKILAYFESKNILEHLKVHPENILNLDESGFELNSMPRKVLTSKKIKHTYKVESGKHLERITVTMCVAADGHILKPQIIYKRSFGRMFDVAVATGEEHAKFEFSQTENGWQTKEAYFGYIKRIHKEQRDRGVQGLIVLYADGYPAHMDLEIYKWCRDHGIIYIIFYPNATHILQPCDLTVFGPLKSQFKKEVTAFKLDHNKIDLDEVDFVKVFSRAIKNGLKPQTIKNGFQSAGLYPFDRERIHFERLIGNGSVNSLPPQQQISSSSGSSDAIDLTIPVLDQSQSLSVVCDQPQLTKLEIIDQMTKFNEMYKKLTTSDDNSSSVCLLIIEQQLSILQSNSTSPPKPKSPAETLREILPPPPPNLRAGRKRQLKIDSSGIMNNDEMIDKQETIMAEKNAIEAAKEEKRRILKEKRELAAKKIKKEKVEKVIKNAAKGKK